MNIISAEFNVNFMSNIEAMLRAAEGMVVCFFIYFYLLISADFEKYSSDVQCH